MKVVAHLFIADQLPTLKYSDITAAQYTAGLHLWLGHIYIKSARKPMISASMDMKSLEKHRNYRCSTQCMHVNSSSDMSGAVDCCSMIADRRYLRAKGDKYPLVKDHATVTTGHANLRVWCLPVNDFCGCYIGRVQADL